MPASIMTASLERKAFGHNGMALATSSSFPGRKSDCGIFTPLRIFAVFVATQLILQGRWITSYVVHELEEGGKDR